MRSLLNKDLGRFEKELATAPISLQGAIATTLVSLEKTLHQYKEQYKQYQVNSPDDSEETKLKYETRLQTLTHDYEDAKLKYAELKKRSAEYNAREQLLNQQASTVEETVMNKRNINAPPQQTSFRMGNPDQQTGRTTINSAAGLPLYEGLRKENSIFEKGNAQLDRILQMGQESLEDIVEQNKVLRRLQSQMSKGLHTLGVSNETIEKINKRLFKDKLIFYLGLILLILGIYFVLKWFA
ncbi:unnamed protein product [Kluyveromyces dobzhanskii CBS 2104]|uniref:Protein transport protein BOS1 n=1 Tax=Kluyveromyces dobzhanskii CBS 2104 TaxID=1427455 RepID=A0A0A8L1Y7_9SACH|nr:unnamed protein product [Kluyveromyces dobzhanskii CBS 2104]